MKFYNKILCSLILLNLSIKNILLNKRVSKKKSFTQGLIVYNNNIIESSGLYNKSFLIEYPINNPLQIIRRKIFPKNIFLEGITMFDNIIFALSWKENVAFKISYQTFEIIEIVKDFNLKFDRKEGWGCTFNSITNQLIISDGSNKLYFLNPNSLEIENTINVEYKFLNELEYFNNFIYANVWQQDFILKVNLENNESKIIKLPKQILNQQKKNGVLNGIAYFKKTNSLIITGKNWDKLYYLKDI